MHRLTFEGRIAGIGSTSGVRVVLGRWHTSSLGTFTDAMVETAEGHRVLLAPTPEVAEFVASAYVFDEVRVEPVDVRDTTDGWRVCSPSFDLRLHVGGRTLLGRLLHLVPSRVAAHPAWASAADPVSRIVLKGVRTRGSARPGRREWYGATDVHDVVAVTGSFDGTPLGETALGIEMGDRERQQAGAERCLDLFRVHVWYSFANSLTGSHLTRLPHACQQFIIHVV